MKTWKKLLAQVVCIGLIGSAFASAQEVAADKNAQRAAGNAARPSDLPDSPGATRSSMSAVGTSKEQSKSLLAQSSTATQAPQAQPTQDQAQPSAQKQQPVGTAAAEAPRTTGIAASQPAGLAIAPAKQKRRRTIIIRTGAIIGAGVAVGTVVGLTRATSSKPPGAH